MDDITVSGTGGVTESTGSAGVVSQQPSADAGEKAGNVTEPPISDNGTQANGTGSTVTEKPTEKVVQTREENSRFAEQRRRYAQELQRQRAGEAERTKAAVDAAIASLGIKDSNGNVITSKEALETAQAERAKAQRSAKLKRLGLDEGTFNDIVNEAVNNHPDVRAAKQAAESARMAEEKASNERAKQAFDADIRTISEKYDPSIKSFADLASSENYADLSKYVRENGLSLVDAYRLANLEKIRAKEIGAARQGAINDINSKSHMQSMGAPIGAGAAAVPARTMQMYRSMGYSDADATAAYNKFLNEQKK